MMTGLMLESLPDDIVKPRTSPLITRHTGDLPCMSLDCGKKTHKDSLGTRMDLSTRIKPTTVLRYVAAATTATGMESLVVVYF